MKSNLLVLLGAAVGFATVGTIAYNLLNRRHTSGSFRELYEDNAYNISEDDNPYTNGEYDDMYSDFVYFPW